MQKLLIDCATGDETYVEMTSDEMANVVAVQAAPPDPAPADLIADVRAAETFADLKSALLAVLGAVG